MHCARTLVGPEYLPSMLCGHLEKEGRVTLTFQYVKIHTYKNSGNLQLKSIFTGCLLLGVHLLGGFALRCKKM